MEVMPSHLSLVSPGVLSTKANFCPINQLKSVLFPELGVPIMERVKMWSLRVARE